MKKVWLISKVFFGQIRTKTGIHGYFNGFEIKFSFFFFKFSFLIAFLAELFWFLFIGCLVVGLLRHYSVLVLFFSPESGFHIWAALSSNFHMPFSFRASWSCPIKREALVRIVWLSLSIPWPFHYSFPSYNGRKNSKPTTKTR